MNLNKRQQNIQKIMAKFDAQPEMRDEIILLASAGRPPSRPRRAWRLNEYFAAHDQYAVIGDQRTVETIGTPYRRRASDSASRNWFQRQIDGVARRPASVATAAGTGAFYLAVSVNNLQLMSTAIYAQLGMAGALWAIAFIAVLVVCLRKRRLANFSAQEMDADLALVFCGAITMPVALIAAYSGLALILAHGPALLAIVLTVGGLWLLIAGLIVGIIGLITSGLRLSLAAVKPLIIGA